MKVVQLLGLRRPWQRQAFRDTNYLQGRSYGSIRVFFQASCRWRSEGLFGQSFSVALPIQALRAIPCLWSFSVVWHVRHIEGSSWLGSYSVDQCIRHLMGHPGWGPTLQFSVSGVCWATLCIVQLPVLVCGEREAMVMAPPSKRDSAVSPCFHGCLAFLHQHFPPQSPPSHPLIHLSTVNSSPRPGIAPQSLNSSSPPLHLPGDQHSCPGFVWLQQGLSDSHSI